MAIISRKCSMLDVRRQDLGIIVSTVEHSLNSLEIQKLLKIHINLKISNPLTVGNKSQYLTSDPIYNNPQISYLLSQPRDQLVREVFHSFTQTENIHQPLDQRFPRALQAGSRSSQMRLCLKYLSVRIHVKTLSIGILCQYTQDTVSLKCALIIGYLLKYFSQTSFELIFPWSSVSHIICFLPFHFT